MNDYLYDVFRGIEVPIQFCYDCHAEWLVEYHENKGEKLTQNNNGR